MDTRIIKVKSCLDCPYWHVINGLDVCTNPKFKKIGGRIFKVEIYNIDIIDWCPLKKLS